MTDERELSRELTALVSSITGVVEVYPAEPVLRAVARDLMARATEGSPDDARVTVTRDPSGSMAVTAIIGVGADHPVPHTLRTVSDALSYYLIERDPLSSAPRVTVTVSRIDKAPVTG